MTARAEVFGRFSGRLPDVDRLLAGSALAALVAEPVVGSLAALGFLAAGMLLLALRPAASVMDLSEFRLVLILPAYCLVSTLWSEVPAQTLRAGVQLFATFVIAILIARRLPPGRFLVLLCGVQLAIVLASVTTGSYRADTGALTGYYGSKNAMGGAAALLAVLAAGLVARPGGLGMRAAALGAAVAGIGAAVLAQSMGALFSLVAGLAAYPLLRAVRPLGLGVQVAVTALAVLAAATLGVVVAANIDALAAFVLDTTGKDITLTGRTDLWRVALDEIAARPLLGTGYQAFWHSGNPLAQSLWAQFGIESRSGFNFHNLYLSNAVEIGILGAGMQATLLLWTGIAALRLALLTRDHRSAAFPAAAVMVLSVTPLEVQVYFQFNLHSLLMIAILVYARDGLAVLAPPRVPRR
ncbi:O-antigen ligase family protein [Roseicyclus sp.]|uniref:O-antigen ligase family protein n=1 Tax=Roseicyclus sp. TaxID=1914329 RepID=UPI003FA00673